METASTSTFLQDKRVAFAGKLGALSRKEAMQVVRLHGGTPLERMSGDIDMVIIGADQLPHQDMMDLLSGSVRNGIRQGTISLIHEHELWQQIGVIGESTNVQLYTPAMLADLVKTPVRNVRRWYRMGLLSCVKVAHRLPYFDFEQVQDARQLTAWIGKGARPNDIRKQLTSFAPWVLNRSLMDLDLVVDGRRLLLRQGSQLLSSSGQLHLDFERLEASAPIPEESTVSMVSAVRPPGDSRAGLTSLDGPDSHWTRDEMLQAAEELEDAGELEQSIEWYRTILARFGLHAEICFQLAELLYRSGDTSAARERYYNAIEIDEDFIEARANLGCVLAETGQIELAIASFQGALSRDDRYPDVHYHLARSLDEIGDHEQSVKHWIRFLQLSPQSPWAEEALERLGQV